MNSSLKSEDPGIPAGSQDFPAEPNALVQKDFPFPNSPSAEKQTSCSRDIVVPMEVDSDPSDPLDKSEPSSAASTNDIVMTPVDQVLPTERNKHLSGKKVTKENVTKALAKASKSKVKIAVNKRSNLLGKAHVYMENETSFYSIDLERIEDGNDGNKIRSTFQMQVLEANNTFWLFTMKEDDSVRVDKLSVQDACQQFKQLYKDKTRNFWELKVFLQVPGMFHPTDECYKTLGWTSLRKDDPQSFKYDGNSQSQSYKSSSSQSWKGRKFPKFSSPRHENVDELVDLLFNVKNIKDSLNVGQVTLEQLKTKNLEPAIKVLDQIWNIFKENPPKQWSKEKSKERKKLSQEFYKLIPVKKDAEKTDTDSFAKFVKNYDLIMSLINIQTACLMSTPVNESSDKYKPLRYMSLNTEISALDQSTGDFKLIAKYVENTKVQGQRLEVIKVFSIKRHGEKDLYRPHKSLGNQKLLWHGTAVTNFASILKLGLQRASTSFGNFGPGIYFNDVVSASVKNCRATPKSNIVLLALCEVSLGTAHIIKQGEYDTPRVNHTKLPKGKHSIVAVGKCRPKSTQNCTRNGVVIPLGKLQGDVTRESSLFFQLATYFWKGTSSQNELEFNEYVVFDEDQINIQYLVKLRID